LYLVTDQAVIDHLKSFGPSHVDTELRSLSPFNGGSVRLMTAFLEAVRTALDACRDFEAAQAYLGLFLKVLAVFFQ
jgi:U3 small nucleolar RNA-associated protein 21